MEANRRVTVTVFTVFTLLSAPTHPPPQPWVRLRRAITMYTSTRGEFSDRFFAGPAQIIDVGIA